MIESIPAPIRFAGLDPDRRYRIERLPLPGRPGDRSLTPPRWLDDDVTVPGVIVRGDLLMKVGLQPPILDPESAMIVRLVAV